MGYKMLCESTWAYKNPKERTFLVQMEVDSHPMATHTINEEGHIIGCHLGSRDETLVKSGMEKVEGHRPMFGFAYAYKVPNFVAPSPGDVFNGPLMKKTK